METVSKDLNRIWMRSAIMASRVFEGDTPKVWRILDKEVGVSILQHGLLEPCAVKVASTVLRGGGRGDTSPLPDIIYVPDSYDETSEVPLMLNFHGYGGTANQQLKFADMRPLADMENFILVYPQGTLLDGDPHWNAGLEAFLKLGFRSLMRFKASDTRGIWPYEKRLTPRYFTPPAKRPDGGFKKAS